MHRSLCFVMLVACVPENPYAIDAELGLHAPRAVHVGETLTLELVGVAGAQEDALTAVVHATPAGLVEAVPDARLTFRAVAAGSVRFEVRMPSFTSPTGYKNVSTSVDISCAERGTQVVTHEAGDIIADETWDASGGASVHRVLGPVTVTHGATLTLGACTAFEFSEGASLSVACPADLTRADPSCVGKLVVRGSHAEPLILRGADTGSGPATWDGIALNTVGGAGSILRGVQLENVRGVQSTVSSRRAALWLTGGPGASVTHTPIDLASVDIADCGDVGLELSGVDATANFEWKDVRIHGCAGYPISSDALSLGAVPSGDFTGNATTTDRNAVGVAGGWTGASYELWRNPGIPYHVQGSLILALDPEFPALQILIGRTTIVDAGVVMQFEHGAGVYVGGTAANANDPDFWPWDAPPTAGAPEKRPYVSFHTQGTLSEPVVFTSAQENPQPGDWIGVVLLPNARTENTPGIVLSQYYGTMFGLVVEYAGATSGVIDHLGLPVDGGVIAMPSCRLIVSVPFWVLEGATLRHNRGYGLVSFHEGISLNKLRAFDRKSALGVCICDNELGDLYTVENETPAGTTACPCDASLQGWPE